MKLRTSELTDAALDWAVTKCMGFDHSVTSSEWGMWGWATDWAQGGPIIEREKIFVKPTINKGWRSYQRDPFGNGICHSQYGPTPLIAAMRCYVASKLGDEVDVPDELIGETKC
jgi:hypothetical protein